MLQVLITVSDIDNRYFQKLITDISDIYLGLFLFKDIFHFFKKIIIIVLKRELKLLGMLILSFLM